MSGLVASRGPVNISESERMLSRLSHRGIDGEHGIAISNNWIGGSWTDSDRTSAQPFTSSDGNLHMVADGEIYNHQSLLEAINAPDVESSIEAVLPLYAHYGM